MRRKTRSQLTAALCAALMVGFLSYLPSVAFGASVLKFNGSTTLVNMGANKFNGLTNATIEAWVKSDTRPTDTQYGMLGCVAGMGILGGGTSGIGLTVSGTSYATTCQFRSGEKNYSPAGPFPFDGVWCHLAGVREGDKVRLYINGLLVDTKDAPLGAINPTVNFGLGARHSGGTSWAFFYNGVMAEVRLWNRARSYVEIYDAMHTRLDGDEAGLIGYWPLNGNANDQQTNLTKNNGSVTKGSWENDSELDAILAASNDMGDYLALPSFPVTDIATGNISHTYSNEVAVALFPVPQGCDAYQVTESGEVSSVVSDGWLLTDAPPATLWFSRPAHDTNVTLYAWFTNTAEVVKMRRRSASIAYRAPRGAFDWRYKMEIGFPGYTRGEALTNFMALVTLTNNMAECFRYADMVSPDDGADLRFIDSDGVAELAYEVEQWDTAGKSLIWVQVPLLADSNTVIYAVWGLPGLSLPDYRTNGLAWPAGYRAVWHMTGSGNKLHDSTMYKLNGTLDSSGVAFRESGMVGGATFFNGTLTGSANSTPSSGGINCGNISITGAQTIEMWMKVDNLSQRRIALNKAYGGEGTLNIFKEGRIVFFHGSAGKDGEPFQSHNTPNDTVVPGTWVHVAHVRRVLPQPRLEWYVNGLLASSAASDYASTATSSMNLYLGKGYNYCFNGLMDEVRLSTVAQSSNTVWATWANTKAGSDFVAYEKAQAVWPLIKAEPATDVGTTFATLNASLLSTGLTATAVTMYWGRSDCGDNAAAWEHSEVLPAPQAEGALSLPVTSLVPDSTYYCRFMAANERGVEWAADAAIFTTSEVWLEKVSDTFELGPVPGTVTVHRAATAVEEPLEVYYTVSGTATPDVDYRALPGVVTIAAGESSAVIAVEAIYDLFTEATETVVITLLPGLYVIGTSDEATVNVIDTGLNVCLWGGGGANALASTAANWVGGVAPVNGDAVRLDTTSNKSMTWDLDTTFPGAWGQTGYTGTVTIPVSTGMLFRVMGLLEVGSGHMVFAGDVDAVGGGTEVVKHGRGYTIEAGSVIVGAAGSINADGKGFKPNNGPGKGKGASHGGHGATADAGATYGLLQYPTALGSGGTTTGTDGGGSLQFVASGTMTVEGRVSADGTRVNNSAGAGGSLSVTAGSLAGNGIIRANGLSSSDTNHGANGGGGGRVALHIAGDDTFSGQIAANGGYGAGAGTIWLSQQKRDNLVLGGAGNMVKLRLGTDDNMGPGGDYNYTFGTITIESGGTLEMQGNETLNVVDDVVQGTAAILQVATLEVKPGGTISANQLGFRHLKGPGSASTSGVGASHGGRGGSGNAGPTYGSLENPVALGSGSSLTGVLGGGAILVNASGAVIIDGLVTANGGQANNTTGSGGTVNITAASLAGSGTIRANGLSTTDVNYGGSSGGGGRIAFHIAGSDTFSGVVEVGNGGVGAGSGTIWLSQQKRDNLALGGAGNMAGLKLGTDDAMGIGGERKYTFGSVTIEAGGKLEIDPNRKLNVVDGVVHGAAALLEVGSLEVKAGAQLAADGLGFRHNSGPGTVAGALHGGRGAPATEKATYGAWQDPVSLGSGGGTYLAYGGGSIRISASGAVTVDGIVSANGTAVNNAAGSGGSINIKAGSLAGSGTIRANGAATIDVNYRQYSAGGGRIAFDIAGSDTFAGLVSANGGAHNARAGTIWLSQQKRDNLVLGGAGNMATLRLGTDDKMGTDGDYNYQFGAITIANGGTLEIDSNYTLNNVNGVAYGAAAVLEVGALEVKTGGLLSANSRGFYNAAGPGKGGNQDGGSHGGQGGNKTASGPSYGSAMAANSIGSGGTSGAGGGALTVVATNTVVVDGIVSADGLGSVNGAGAGGAVNIVAPAITGGGTIRANGGSANANMGSGGGGRVTLRQTSGATFTGLTILANGGTGGAKGAGGTVALATAGTVPGGGALRVATASAAAIYTPLPGSRDPALWADELREAVLEVAASGVMSLTTNIVVRDLFLNGPNPSLYLNGHVIKVRSRYHEDANTNRVVFAGGDIIWQRPGTVLMLR